MNPEIKQRIENLVGGSTFLPASSGATSGSKFDPMRVPSVDKDELLASINSMKGEGQDYSNPEDGLQIPDAGQSPADRLQMILEQTGIRSQEDLLKVEPYLPDLGPGVSINDRLAALPLSAIPVIKKMIFGIGKGVVDDARALVKSKSIPEAVMNASRLYPPAMKARMGMDAITAGIDALRKAEGGEVSQEELMMQAAQSQAGGEDSDELIRSAIEEMMMQASQAEDPAERDQYLHLAEAAEVGAAAPMAEMAIQLAQAGRGEDTALAHLRPGEVVIPPEAFEDPEFESLIEKKFKELNIDPARMVVGVGIASLNPITGLEEFGWFKKVAKSTKKVVTKVIKPLAAVAQFIPGPWQPFAALANRAFTVYDVAKGRASPLSLLSLATPIPGGAGSGGIGSLFSGAKEFVTKGADGVGLLGNIGKGIGNVSKGIGSLVTGAGADGVGSFGKLGDLVTGAGADGVGSFGKLGDLVTGTGADGVGSFGKLGDLVTGTGADGVGRFGKLGDIFTSTDPDKFSDLGKNIDRPTGADGVGRFGKLGDLAGDFGEFLKVGSYGGQDSQQEDPVIAISEFLTKNPDKYDAINEMYAKGMTDEQIAQQLFGQASPQASPQKDPVIAISEFLTKNPDKYGAINEMYAKGMTDEQIAQQLFSQSVTAAFEPPSASSLISYQIAAPQSQGGGTPQWLKTIGDYLGFGGKSGLEDVYGPGTTNPVSGMLGGVFGGSGAGGLNLGGIGGAGVAAVLGKLAYDEAKNRKGVQLSPAMTMSRYGGYQLAKRDAEAAGLPAPDRRDFGMMEDMPVLSGGRKTPVAEEPVTGMRYGGAVMPTQMRYGGMVPMAYATGGKVSTEDFKKKNGKINGEGTETSDDIPAMLSDGEFVMTGQAVRGAGSFELNANNGIITLTPNGGEDRDKGTQLMYEMMELFAEYADKPRPKRVKAA
jgi:hypothetical protein